MDNEKKKRKKNELSTTRGKEGGGPLKTHREQKYRTCKNFGGKEKNAYLREKEKKKKGSGARQGRTGGTTIKKSPITVGRP